MKTKKRKPRKKPTQSASPDPAVARVVEFNRLVTETCDKAYKLMQEAVLPFSPGERWLLISRIVSRLFQGHFRMALETAEERARCVANESAAKDAAYQDHQRIFKEDKS